MRLPNAVGSNVGAFLDVDFNSRRYDINLFVTGGKLYARANDSIMSIYTSDGRVDIVTGSQVEVAGSPSAYHMYQMIFNPVTQLATLYIDGSVAIPNYAGHADFLTNRGLWFGAIGQSANFNLAQFSIGEVPIYVVTPEPVAALLAGFGLVAIAILRKRRSC